MSLIFQTLGKLDAEQTENHNMGEPLSHHQEMADTPPARSDFKRVLWLAGGIAVGLMLLGVGAVVVVHYISSHNKVTPVHAANTAVTVDSPAQPVQPTVARQPSEQVRPRFVSPDSQDSGGQPHQAVADKVSSSTTSNDDSRALFHEDEKLPAKGQKMATRDDAIALDAAHVAPKYVTGMPVAPSVTNGTPERSNDSRPGLHQATSSTTDSLTQEQHRRQAAFRLARQKSDRISRIVLQLETALSQMPDNAAQIETLFNELAQIKGDNSDYVSKMRAFWLLKQKKYEQAEIILKRLSSGGDADPNVGINLAIIDLHKGNRNDALHRLSQLRRTHPENTYIANLLRKLQ